MYVPSSFDAPLFLQGKPNVLVTVEVPSKYGWASVEVRSRFSDATVEVPLKYSWATEDVRKCYSRTT